LFLSTINIQTKYQITKDYVKKFNMVNLKYPSGLFSKMKRHLRAPKEFEGVSREFREISVPLGFPGPFSKMKMPQLVIFKNEKEILLVDYFKASRLF